MRKRIINKNIKSLYVHIPFCEHICFYCDFVKIKKDEKVSVSKYFEVLKSELDTYNNKLDNLETIYIGGGTPSSLNLEDTKIMLDLLSKYAKNLLEYSIEVNPENVTEEKLNFYKEYGIDRLSIGVQSFSNNLLKKIGRLHDNNTAIEAFKLARSLGFENISIDLMYNLFDQKPDDIIEDLKYIKKLKPDHISWYSLIMKPDSIWGKQDMELPENDEVFDNLVNNGLKKLGYQRYEISNYCLNNKKSLHNISYWNNSLFAGVGVGASGFEVIENKLYLTKNIGNYLEYKKTLEELSDEDYMFQILMMGLRVVDGIDLLDEDKKLILEFYKEKINENIAKKFLKIENNRLFCTKRGFDILNEVLENFL